MTPRPSPPLAGLLLHPQRWRLWAAAAVLATGAGGCLLDYGDTVTPLRPASNRPPRIEEKNVQPQRLVTLDPSQPGGCTEDLTFRVTDPDVGDPIRVWWIVDFDRNASSGVGPRVEKTEYIAPNSVGGEIRTTSALLTLDPADTASPVASPGVHLVEAFVSDGEIRVQVNTEDQTVTLESDDVTDREGNTSPSFLVSYAWFVTTQAGCTTSTGGGG